MMVFEVNPGKGLNRCTEKNAEAVLVWLQEAQPGDTIIVNVKEMTEEAYAHLPEYMGP